MKSDNIQVKPLVVYKTLSGPDKRLVNKLIVSIHKEQLPQDDRRTINRSINRARNVQKDNGKKYTNGYLIFYKERFPKLKLQDMPICDIAKHVGKEWRELDAIEKEKYNLLAKEQRE